MTHNAVRWARAGARPLAIFLLAGLVAAVPLAQAQSAQAQSQPATPAKADAAMAPAAWSGAVWQSATAGDEQRFHDLLGAAPLQDDAAGATLRASIDLLNTNLAKRETERAKQLEEVNTKLDEHLAINPPTARSLSDALAEVVGLEMLLDDKDKLMADPRVGPLVEKAVAEAKAAEDRGEWLTANELYYRLDVLFEHEGTYHPDMVRENERLAMIRLYDPQRFWSIRNDRQLADGEVALPPYNPIGDDYKTKLAGITTSLVSEAIARAASQHVDWTPLSKLLDGGVRSVRTLVETPDLGDAFPGIKDDEARERFLAFLDTEAKRIKQLGANADNADLRVLLKGMQSLNRETVQIPDTALLHEFGNGAMSALDEFSAIIWPDEIRRFNRNTSGKFEGIGVQIELDPLSNIRVVTPLEGTPAQRIGIRAGDIIKKVNGQATLGFTLDQAVDVITGPDRTPVTLTVEREETPEGAAEAVKTEYDYTITRANIKLAAVRGWKRLDANEYNWDWMIDPRAKIGYIRLIQFQESSTLEFDNAIRQMKEQGMQALILDLRFNPGGLLDQAVNIASRFVDGRAAQGVIKDGVIVRTQDGRGRESQDPEVAEQGEAALANTPVIVLVNEGSASASEIVSGAIQDYARAGIVNALLIGDRSFGKGSVQNVWYLNTTRNAAMKLTTSYYQLPGGRLIHRRPGRLDYGVAPNMTVDMLPTQLTAAITLRRDADVVRIDEQGKPIPQENPPDVDTLITDGTDLQLQTALVLLQTQVALGNHQQAGLPAKGPDVP
jgi:carboxyl-terminal processing protease